MNAYDVNALMDSLETARIYAGAEFERLCNSNQYIDACVFQAIRDSIEQNRQLLRSYVNYKAKKEADSSSDSTTDSSTAIKDSTSEGGNKH